MAKKKRQSRAEKVLHISRFRQRYELPEDVRLDRKSPLIYTKDFVGGGSDDESCAHWRQLMALRSKTNWLMLRGAFAELKNVAGNMSKEYRGYLLDSNFQQASVKEIGRWLGVGEKKAEKIIEELRDVGLLEYVALPQFNGQPRKRKPNRARARPGKSGRAQTGTGKSGKSQAPLKKKAKAKANANANANVKAKANAKVNGDGKGNTKRAKERQSKDKPQEAPPSAAQPLKPQIPQKRGSLIQFTGPSELPNTERLGCIANKILHKFNPDAKQFAFEVYQALKLPWDPTSEMGRRELGCFASVWQKVAGWKNAGIPLPVIDELRERAIAEARKIAHRRQNRKKGAVWCFVFKRIVAAKGVAARAELEICG